MGQIPSQHLWKEPAGRSPLRPFSSKKAREDVGS